MSWSAPIRLLVVLAIAGLVAYVLPGTRVNAGIANHVVISEIQVAGDTANDEFIELYNPTSQPVNITGWKLRKTGGTNGNIITSMSGTIQPYSYYLIAPDGYTGEVPRDAGYSNASSVLTGDNSVLLSDATDTFVDVVGMGSSPDAELFSTLDPIAGESVERKALPGSSSNTMDVGGIHALLGNGEDTNNNGSDFVSRNIPQPQNSSSPIENPNIAQPSPTVAPTAAPTAIPSPTTVQPSPTATLAPTAAPSPTIAQPTPTANPSPTLTPAPTTAPSVTPAPSVAPSPTATLAPTAAPTAIPSPTGVMPSVTPVPGISPTNAPTPTVAPSPTPTPVGEVVMMDNEFMTCKKTYRSISIMFLTFRMPSFSCLSK
jgi:hypothetical protein